MNEELAFFFELFFFDRKETRRRTERLAKVVHREVLDVKRNHTRRCLLVDDDGHGTPLDALAKRETAAAGEAGVREAFQHDVRIILQPSRADRAKAAS